MTLVDAIDKACTANEKKLLDEVRPPVPELVDAARAYIDRFTLWCKSRGVKALPCAPATLAAFCRAENAFGVPPDRIFDEVRAVEQAHDAAYLSNPAATLAVRTELGRILNIPEDGPRSWPKTDRPLYASLPIEVRAVIARREEQTSTALRRLQNRMSDLSKKELKQNAS